MKAADATRVKRRRGRRATGSPASFTAAGGCRSGRCLAPLGLLVILYLVPWPSC